LHGTPQEGLFSSKPPDVNKAVKLLYASLLLGIAVEVADFTYLKSLRSAGFALFISLFTFGLLLFLIMKISSGRNWARIIFLVLFLAGIPLFLPNLRNELKRNPFAATISIVQVILQVVAFFLLFKGTSGIWFKKNRTT
jgi:hypothetical protein